MKANTTMTTAATPRILAFDIFGTVVDWHTSIANEVEALRPGVDGSAFALAWRAGYAPAMQRVMRGELGWTQVMMVATHQSDLAAARNCGLQNAYIERPFEYGPGQAKDSSPNPANTVHATGLRQLADQLGC